MAITHEVADILDRNPGWFGRALVCGDPTAEGPDGIEAVGGVYTWRTTIPIVGLTPEELAECVRNNRAAFLANALDEVAHHWEQEHRTLPDTDWLGLWRDDADKARAILEEERAERKRWVAEGRRDVPNYQTCYAYLGTAVTADVCGHRAHDPQHGRPERPRRQPVHADALREGHRAPAGGLTMDRRTALKTLGATVLLPPALYLLLAPFIPLIQRRPVRIEVG